MFNIKKKTKNIFVPPQLIFKKRHKKKIIPQIYNLKLTSLQNFSFGVKALEAAKTTYKQTESLRRTLVRKLKKRPVFFTHSLIANWPVSQKSRGVRMGKGKGPVGYWINRLSSAKISLFFQLPSTLHSLSFFKDTYNSIRKRLNFLSTFILNPHLAQEYYINIAKKSEYWKLIS